MATWKVWYGDGTVHSDDDGPPDQTPALGVQVVAQADEKTGRLLLSGRDYYWWQDGRWWAGDLFGAWDYLARPGWKRLLFGRMIDDDRWNAVLGMALADPDLPDKSAADKREQTRR